MLYNMVNHRKPKYSDPSKEAERIRNLPEERIRIPASRQFAEKGMHETPIVTAEVISKLAKKIKSTNYYQRLDGVKGLGELAEKGTDISDARPALDLALNDYSPGIVNAAKEALRKTETKKAENFKFPRGHMDLRPIVIFQGQNFTLAEAISQGPNTRKKAVEKIKFIAQQNIRYASFGAKLEVIKAVEDILSNPSERANVNDAIKINMIKIFDDLKNDIDGGIRSISEIMLKEVKNL